MEDASAAPAAPAEPEEEPLPEEVLNGTPEDIMTRVRLIDNDLKVSSVEGISRGLGTRERARECVVEAGETRSQGRRVRGRAGEWKVVQISREVG